MKTISELSIVNGELSMSHIPPFTRYVSGGTLIVNRDSCAGTGGTTQSGKVNGNQFPNFQIPKFPNQ